MAAAEDAKTLFNTSVRLQFIGRIELCSINLIDVITLLAVFWNTSL